MTATEARTEARLPVPDWDRLGESWRVEPEPNMVVVESGGYCTHRTAGMDCPSQAVAGTRRSVLLLCARHLRESRMWIERGRVVSWRLSR